MASKSSFIPPEENTVENEYQSGPKYLVLLFLWLDLIVTAVIA